MGWPTTADFFGELERRIAEIQKRHAQTAQDLRRAFSEAASLSISERLTAARTALVAAARLQRDTEPLRTVHRALADLITSANALDDLVEEVTEKRIPRLEEIRNRHHNPGSVPHDNR